jgi:hypothetical protein
VRVAVVVSVMLGVVLLATSPGHAQPLTTALLIGNGMDASTVTRLHAAGTEVVRLSLDWPAIAPKTHPDGFDAADPGDTNYRWGPYDREISAAVSAGFQPLLYIVGAPSWAEQSMPKPYYGAIKPDAKQLALFAHATATRYGGSFQGLPRVRNWMLWNEPNLVFWLQPQFVGGEPYSPALYRAMLNAFADAIHGVHANNVVIAGGTAPFTSADGTTEEWGVGPLAFLRGVLCLGKNLRPVCSARAKFDVWAHHPYTSGGPTHHANFPDDVSLGDLPKLKAVLDAGVRTHKILSRGRVRFWVTEFSWDTSPPDPQAVPLALQTRWTAEAMYTMWRNGVSLVTWFQLVDAPFPGSPYQSGLYFINGKPKPTLTAFRFPFVALKQNSRLRLWGRTPLSTPGRVVVQKKTRFWRTVATLRANQYGIFNATRAFAAGVYRARFGTSRSLAFSTTEPPDHFYRPFGSP